MSKKKITILTLAVMALSAFAVFTGTYYNVARIGPYFITNYPFDSTNMGNTGGQVVTYLSGDTEYIGQVVYISAKNTVKHDTVATHYNALAGVVVGGTQTNMQASGDSASVGDTASFIGGRVLVLVTGRAWVKTDTTAAFSPGTMVVPSNRSGQAGKVQARTTAIDTFFRSVGRIVDSGVTNTKRLINVKVK